MMKKEAGRWREKRRRHYQQQKKKLGKRSKSKLLNTRPAINAQEAKRLENFASEMMLGPEEMSAVYDDVTAFDEGLWLALGCCTAALTEFLGPYTQSGLVAGHG